MLKKSSSSPFWTRIKEQNDQWANKVCMRVYRVISDLHVVVGYLEVLHSCWLEVLVLSRNLYYFSQAELGPLLVSHSPGIPAVCLTITLTFHLVMQLVRNENVRAVLSLNEAYELNFFTNSHKVSEHRLLASC